MEDTYLDYLTVLKNLIQFPTVNDPAKEICPTRECPEYLEAILAQMGYKTKIVEQMGFFSVLATHGTGRPVTLVLAHFDVVPVSEGWDSDPFELMIKGEMGYGRGTADDKGNTTALLLSAEEIMQHEIDGTVAFAMTGDEEIGGMNGAPVVRAILEKRNLFPDYLVTADGVGMQIVTRRRNTVSVTVSVPQTPSPYEGGLATHRFTTEYLGRQSRHSAYFLPGVDRHALLAASSFLLHNPEIQVKSAAGSYVKSNVVPDWFEITSINPAVKVNKQLHTCDNNLTQLLQVLLPISRIQFPTFLSDYGITFCPNLLYEHDNRWVIYFDGRAMTMDAESVQKALDTVLIEKLAGIEYQRSVKLGKAYMNTPTKSHLVTTAQQVAKTHSQKIEPIELGGASDTRHFTDREIQAIDFGPIGYGIHGSNEHVLLESILQTAKFYTDLIRTLHSSSKF
ncbi:MAG: M20/M25/M40 family metallo-hydrolase [Promethearchaeota archaeon]